jgi:hypothetical protein
MLGKKCHVFFVDICPPTLLRGTDYERHQLGVFHRFLTARHTDTRSSAKACRVGPIAVVIPKLDSLTQVVSTDRQVRAGEFLDLVNRAGPVDEKTTMSAIRRRSKLVEEYADLLPCVSHLASRLRRECGPDGFMFFPTTAYGWNADQHDGIPTEIVSWATLDPLLWLFHVSSLADLPP